MIDDIKPLVVTFEWVDQGKQYGYEYPSNVRGITLKGERPDTLRFNRDPINDDEYEWVHKEVIHCVKGNR